jgi:hypothetical protein
VVLAGGVNIRRAACRVGVFTNEGRKGGGGDGGGVGGGQSLPFKNGGERSVAESVGGVGIGAGGEEVFSSFDGVI